ncbi:MAG: flagellar hook assembly protein FlgD [Methylococcaceae bacterium]|nr:flagellar hook assembly protein FlgD [Methylococcaceae bacterium]
MTTIDTKTLDALGLTQKPAAAATNGNALGQDVFMKLLVAQLQNQNPLNPQDGKDFVAQLAQFSVVEGIESMKSAFSDFSSSSAQGQGLQMANLVGKNVLVAADRGVLDSSGSVRGKLNLADPSDRVTVDIYDESGKAIRSIDLGAQPAGEVEFTWDGKLDDGITVAPKGVYGIKAKALQNGGGQLALQPQVEAPVESVVMGGANGVQVDLGVLGKHGLKDILEVL